MLTQKEVNALLGVKVCSQCGETKSLDQFHKRTRSSDGHRSECKACKKIYDDDRNHKTKDQPKEIVYPESLVMDSLENDSWTMFDYMTALAAAFLIAGSVYYYLKGI